MIIAAGILLSAALFTLPRLVTNWMANRAPEVNRGTSLLWPSLLFLLIGGLLDPSGLLVLLFIVFWCLIWTWRLRSRWAVALPLSVLLVAIIATSQGYKLYGSPELWDNRPLLQHPHEIVRLESPNIVVCSDGSRHAVAGIEFRNEVLTLSPEEQRSAIDRRAEALRISPDSTQPSGYVAEHRINYFCGNSFFPTFLPQRLPTHRTEDLAVALRWLAVHDPTERYNR